MWICYWGWLWFPVNLVRAQQTNEYWILALSACIRWRQMFTCGRDASRKIYCKYTPHRYRPSFPIRGFVVNYMWRWYLCTYGTVFPLQSTKFLFILSYARQLTHKAIEQTWTHNTQRIESLAHNTTIRFMRTHSSHRWQHFHAAGRTDKVRLVISFVLILAASRRSKQTASLCFLVWLKYARFLWSREIQILYIEWQAVEF